MIEYLLMKRVNLIKLIAIRYNIDITYYYCILVILAP